MTKRERGQALTEFLVAAVALLPLFLLMPLIAKYQDIGHATQVASRYAAFEATLYNDTVNGWRPPAQLAADVQRRFFSNVDAPIKSGDVAGNFKANQNLFWRIPRDQPLIKDVRSDVQVSFGASGARDHTDGFSSASDGAPFVLHGPLGLPARGIYSAKVTVALANVPSGLRFHEPFDTLNLTMQRGTSLLLDPWTARNPIQAESRIAANPAIFPVGALSSINPMVDAAVSVVELPGGFSGPRLGKLDFWRDVVPGDRLKSEEAP